VRMRDLPFTPERVKAALDGQSPARLAPPPAAPPRQSGWMSALGAAVTGGLMTAAIGLSWHAAIPRAVSSVPSMFSEEAIARGRVLFALGDCATCHTTAGGLANAGGRAVVTPFGTVYSTNLTADFETGMGGWTYPAFVRAMRDGIGRDGRHLYPAFPYTAFAKLSETDMQSLFAYIQTIEPVRQATPVAQMAVPANLRSTMAAWNLAFHDSSPFQPDQARSGQWPYAAQSCGGRAWR
jgi:nicotinate dehydrogenase subunit B